MRWVAGLALIVAVALLALGMARPKERWQELAIYETPLAGRSGPQAHNARLAAQTIDGTVIPPGGALSLTKTLGAWTKDRGYVKAPVAFNGNLIAAYGGGVCQTSTTLYNAALLAGLKVVERHRHHHMPSYVAPGRDAAIAFPNLDLRLRNPYDFPIQVRASVKDDRVRVAFFGLGLPEHEARVDVVVHDRIEPGLIELGSGPNRRLRNPGHAGYEVSVFRTVGNRRERVTTDTYPASNRVVERYQR